MIPHSRAVKLIHQILCLLSASLAFASVIHAETEPAPIPFAEIGAKATADYQGDGIGILTTPEGAILRTGFQKLAGNVTSEGLTLVSTEDDGGSMKLTAASIGRSSTDAPPPIFLTTIGKVSVGGKLARWCRPGLVEEYSVSADGVRQDFIITTRPPGTGELNLQLALTGASAAANGDGVILKLHTSGRELAYSRLRVEDATGRTLNARFAIPAADRLSVRVDDANAVYPIRIDPTFSDADWVGLNPSISGANGRVNAIAFDGGDMYVGGSFSAISNIRAQGVAKWNGSTWSALGSGVAVSGSTPEVKCLTVSGGILYVGGNFTSAGGMSARRVASWDGSNWAALGSGLSGGSGGPVHALTSYGNLVYAGGEFATAGGSTANCVAVWNGSVWSALSSGIGGTGTVRVNALAMSGSDLIVGGQFITAGGVTANRIAKWSGSAWSALGTGIDNNWVNCVAVKGSDIYVGGTFLTVGGVTMNRVAKWNGSAWSALGTGVNSTIFALAASTGTLYAAGDYSLVGVNGTDIAAWNGSTWSSVGSGAADSYQVYSLALSGSTLYAGGDFERVGGVGARNIAKWNGSSWASIAPGVSNSVSAMIVIGTNLYIGGRFVSAGGVTASRIAKWDGSNWSALGTGIEGGYAVTQVSALAQIEGVLYAGGDFTRAGGVTVNGVAKWNGSAWSALGAGVQNGTVHSLAASGGNLYIGGNFTTVDWVPCNHIARWNGSAWSALGTGMTPPSYLGEGVVNCLMANGTDLYAGGVFTAAGGVSSNGIAKWNGTNWAAIGTGMNDRVTALAWIGSELYAGGRFTTAGGVAASRIAKWNGSAWAALGSGLNSNANVLAVNNGYLYAGGSFTTAGGLTANGIARWSGSVWTGLGSGTNNNVAGGGGGVNSLFVSANTLYVGGGFTQVGTTYSPFIAKASIVGDTVPEITVSGNGVEIADGDMTPSLLDGTDFGDTVVGTTPVNRTFTITNLGGVALNLTGTAPTYVTLAGSSAFTVTAQPADSTVPPNDGSRTFTIRYNPSATGTHTASVSLANSDSNENPYNFAIQATGISTPVPFEGGSLEAAIRTALQKPTGTITEVDMLGLSNLNLSNLGITNLTGLQFATNLRILNIRGNPFTNAATTWAILDQLALYCLYTDLLRPGGNPQGLTTQSVTDTFGGTFFISVNAPNLPILNIIGLGIDTANQTNLAALHVFADAGVTVEAGANLPPVARAVATVTNHPAGTVILNGGTSSDVDGTVVSWSWSWPGGSALGVNPMVTLPVGETSVSLTATDDDGAPSSTSVLVTVVTLASAIQNSGLTGNDALPTATPFDDGVENLLKYAFNMNLAGPDVRSLPPGTGTSGLPSITTPDGAPAGTIRVEFLRRKGSGLIYTPQKSTTLDGPGWTALSAIPVVTSINEQWERVIYVEPPAPIPAPTCFGRVSVSLP